MKPDNNTVDTLQVFPFLIPNIVLQLLKCELPQYMAKTADVSEQCNPLEWWKMNANELPNCVCSFLFNVYSFSACFATTVFSAASERVFSLY